MKITDIKRNGKKLTEKQMTTLVEKLRKKATKAGFQFSLDRINSSRVDLSGTAPQRGPQRIKPTYRVTDITIESLKKGYRKAYKPTWEQYESLNHAVNDVLDQMKLTATVKSKEFDIRDKNNGRINEWSEPYWVIQNRQRGCIDETYATEKEAQEHVDTIPEAKLFMHKKRERLAREAAWDVERVK